MRNRLGPLALFVVAVSLAAAPAPAASVVRVRTLAAPAPVWFTSALARRALEAGPRGVPLPTHARVPASSLAFVGIRPGQQIVITDTTDLTRARRLALCTSNFVFTSSGSSGSSGSSRSRPAAAPAGGRRRQSVGSTMFIGTAGHCGKQGDNVFMIFAPLGVVHIGDIVQSTGDPGDRLAPDFALIAILPALNQWVSPSMAHWGGPTGAFAGGGLQPIVHSGHGVVAGTGGTPRAALAYRWGDEYRFEGVVTPGDSGSGAIVVGGLAAGNITHIAVDTREDVPVWNGGTSMTKILSLVGNLQLATCALPVPWPAPGCPPLG